MTAIVTTIINLLSSILPLLTTSDKIAQVIAVLINIIPILVKEAQDMVQPVKNIINSLSANPATTAEQLATLQALDAQVDAEFEAEATRATDEDKS